MLLLRRPQQCPNDSSVVLLSIQFESHVLRGQEQSLAHIRDVSSPVTAAVISEPLFRHFLELSSQLRRGSINSSTTTWTSTVERCGPVLLKRTGRVSRLTLSALAGNRRHRGRKALICDGSVKAADLVGVERGERVRELPDVGVVDRSENLEDQRRFSERSCRTRHLSDSPSGRQCRG